MKKFFKTIFGRMAITIFLLALQYLLYLALTRWLENTVQPAVIQTAKVIVFALMMLSLVHIVNRDMTPNGKLPWIILVLLFPLTGTLLYFLFSQNRVDKKQYRFFTSIYNRTLSVLGQIDDSVLFEQAGTCGGQSKYISEASMTPCHDGTRTKYFADGEPFWKDMLSEMEKAEKFIFLEYFIIQEGKMWNTILDVLVKKIAQGVEVRLIYDDIGCISKLPSNYFKKMRKLGIDCVRFNKFTPIATALHNNRDHRKITVIDGKVGYMGGINLADEYINAIERFGYWKDTAVKLEGKGVVNMTVMFLQLFDVAAKREEDFGKYVPEKFERFEDEGLVQPFGDGPRPMYVDTVAENTFLNVINQSQKYLYVTTPYLIIDDELRNAFVTAAKRGVDVRIITPQIPDKKIVFDITRYNYIALMAAGVKIYEFTGGFMHAKSILADDAVGVVGTINMDYRSLLHHYECGVWMYKTTALAELKADLMQLFDNSELQTKCKLNKFKRFFCMLAMAFTPLL